MSDELSFDAYHKPVRCERCGGNMIFKGVGEYICDSCGSVDYDDYGIVRNYLEQHKGATAGEIAEMTGVSQTQINLMIREERIQITQDSKVFMRCQGCGREIRLGMYCDMCSRIATAMENKKRRAEALEHRKKAMSGTAAAAKSAESGAKRFKIDR